MCHACLHRTSVELLNDADQRVTGCAFARILLPILTNDTIRESIEADVLAMLDVWTASDTHITHECQQFIHTLCADIADLPTFCDASVIQVIRMRIAAVANDK